MFRLRQSLSVTAYNFRMWHRNPRVIMTFALAFVLCFLLSDKVVQFSYEQQTTMQIVEAFVWTFGDANSILLSSLLLVMLFADMPFLTAGTPLYLVRINRRRWLLGQAIYIAAATLIYMLFILAATSLICMGNSFAGNMWSETAAILGYSNASEHIAVPALVKTLEMSRPYESMATIFGLMLCYTLVMVFIMLFFNIRKNQAWGVAGVFGFSLYGFLLNPQLFKVILNLNEKTMYRANVLVGWISPLNQATYHMHNFGYDLLPRMWMTFAIFAVLILLLFFFTLRAIKRYNFNFRGQE